MEEAMKLEFLYTPTRDLQASLALYRDELGWEEAWREGESTVSLKVPGSDVQLMLDVVEDNAGSAFGPVFVLDDLRRFEAERPPRLRATSEPQEIPGGYLATYQDPSGNTIYVMDQSLEASGSQSA
jgi:catechol 2,3-dioxygenase-like lactoylglutathione lyase family enzyme